MPANATRMFEHLREELERRGSLTVVARVRPGVSTSAFRGVMDDGSLKIDIAAVPGDEAAHAELLRFLAEAFGVPRGNIPDLLQSDGTNEGHPHREDAPLILRACCPCGVSAGALHAGSGLARGCCAARPRVDGCTVEQGGMFFPARVHVFHVRSTTCALCAPIRIMHEHLRDV